jgi:hypothetical protein
MWMSVGIIVMTGLFAWGAAAAFRHWSRKDALSQALEKGSEALVQGQSKWFGVEWNQHKFVLIYIKTPPHLGGDTQRPTLKLVLAASTTTRLQASVFRRVDTLVPINQRFENSFEGDGLDRIAPATRAELIAFSTSHGSVWLRDRLDAPEGLVPKGVLTQATVLIGWLAPYEFNRRRIGRAMDGLIRISGTLTSQT